jgi:N-acetylglutamate synthase-like GNAT family acetyltransferase
MNLHREEIWNGFLFSTDKNRLDHAYIHQFISTKSYWAKGIPRSIIDQSIENSLTFGVYENSKQVGFARMISDLATFGYLADVFVDEGYRKKGLSKHLLEFIFSIKEFESLRRIMLGTKDAHTLYEKYNFKPLGSPERFMEIARPDIYELLNGSLDI